ncbi:hypothetical protein DMC30DRAFT_183115 [Rhodotorula diobovata]|uniref:Uncharacterized protein n=1 Tax=Rhodotorula diobovata TaxID=5288 RepID=A0A5C5FY46_9BASI|nr:hypothetical protein DMC30DRAFT_183115 [Rhodotorula diobovata]
MCPTPTASRPPTPRRPTLRPFPKATVLFPDPAVTFPSSDHFLTACRDRLLERYGVSIEQFWVSEMSATAKCMRRRGGANCPFTVRAVEEDGVWVLEEETCVWEHSHADERGDAAAADVRGDEGTASGEDASCDSSEESDDFVRAGASSAPWGAKTRSSLVRRIVNARGRIFAQTRACQDATRAAASQRAVDAYIAEAKAVNPAPRALSPITSAFVRRRASLSFRCRPPCSRSGWSTSARPPTATSRRTSTPSLRSRTLQNPRGSRRLGTVSSCRTTRRASRSTSSSPSASLRTKTSAVRGSAAACQARPAQALRMTTAYSAARPPNPTTTATSRLCR